MTNNKQEFPRPAGSEVITHQGKILEIVSQRMEVAPDNFQTFEWARRTPGVRLIIPSKDGKSVLLTKEYRHELKGYDYRLPGGKVFNTLVEYNEFRKSGDDISSPADAKVIGEAIEETGLVVKSARVAYTSKLGSTVEWDLYYYIVEEFEEHPDGQQQEDGEYIAPEWIPLDKAKDMALNGHMSEERSALILLRYLTSLEK